MRRARGFNPEWGYLAPAPTLMRSVRIAAVSAIVGATASAAVVFALIDRPDAEESVAARTLVTRPAAMITTPVASAPAAQPVTSQVTSQVASAPAAGPSAPNLPAPAAALPNAPPAAAAVAVDSGTQPATQRPPISAALAEAPAIMADAPAAQGLAPTAALAPAPVAPAQKRVVKKVRTPSRSEQAWRDPLGIFPGFYGRNTARAYGGEFGMRGEY